MLLVAVLSGLAINRNIWQHESRPLYAFMSATTDIDPIETLSWAHRDPPDRNKQVVS